MEGKLGQDVRRLGAVLNLLRCDPPERCESSVARSTHLLRSLARCTGSCGGALGMEHRAGTALSPALATSLGGASSWPGRQFGRSPRPLAS